MLEYVLGFPGVPLRALGTAAASLGWPLVLSLSRVEHASQPFQGVPFQPRPQGTLPTELGFMWLSSE